MRRAIKTLDEAVRNVEDVAPVCAFADALLGSSNNNGVSDRVFLDLVERSASLFSSSRWRRRRKEEDEEDECVAILVRFTMDERIITDALFNGKEERGVLVLDANAFGAFDATEKPLDALLGKLGEILDKRQQPAMEEGKREAAKE